MAETAAIRAALRRACRAVVAAREAVAEFGGHPRHLGRAERAVARIRPLVETPTEDAVRRAEVEADEAERAARLAAEGES